MKTNTLSAELLQKIDAYWRAPTRGFEPLASAFGGHANTMVILVLKF